MATKYLLAEVTDALQANDVETAVITKRPGKFGNKTLNTTGCGLLSDGFTTDTNFANKLMVGSYVAITNEGDYRRDRQQAVAWADSAPSPGKKLSAFIVLDSGAVCTEDINGISYSFKKYSCTVED